MRSKEPDKPDPIIDAVGRLFMDCSRVVREARYTVHVNKIRQLIPGGTWDVELATAEAIWAQEPSKPTRMPRISFASQESYCCGDPVETVHHMLRAVSGRNLPGLRRSAADPRRKPCCNRSQRRALPALPRAESHSYDVSVSEIDDVAIRYELSPIETAVLAARIRGFRWVPPEGAEPEVAFAIDHNMNVVKVPAKDAKPGNYNVPEGYWLAGTADLTWRTPQCAGWPTTSMGTTLGFHRSRRTPRPGPSRTWRRSTTATSRSFRP